MMTCTECKKETNVLICGLVCSDCWDGDKVKRQGKP